MINSKHEMQEGKIFDSVYFYSVSFIIEEEMLSNTPVRTKVLTLRFLTD